jgi:hypothetical protein
MSSASAPEPPTTLHEMATAMFDLLYQSDFERLRSWPVNIYQNILISALRIVGRSSRWQQLRSDRDVGPAGLKGRAAVTNHRRRQRRSIPTVAKYDIALRDATIMDDGSAFEGRDS